MSSDRINAGDVENILNEIGQVYVNIRRECNTECANLFDTHEITLAEKNCTKNCFKKLSYAYYHFNKLATQNLEKVNRLNNESILYKY